MNKEQQVNMNFYKQLHRKMSGPGNTLTDRDLRKTMFYLSADQSFANYMPQTAAVCQSGGTAKRHL